MAERHLILVGSCVLLDIYFDNAEALEKALKELSMNIESIPLPAAFNVSRVFRQYRQNRGDKKSPMPDFYIGEHAKCLNIPLVTRDTARFKTYQPNLMLITPEKNYR